MDVERYRQVGELYHTALGVDADVRAAFLERACAGDTALRHEVESLIASHERAGDFIAEPALKVAAELLAEGEVDALVGRTIGRYRVLSLVGAGGMGRVYLAEDTALHRRVALKLLPEYSTHDKSQVQRFHQEARAASALNHPNILTVYEVGSVDRAEFIATEYVEGETLRARLTRAPCGLSEALDVAVQIADALAAAHEAGIVHRDTKPENVMLRADGYVKVLDFGLAKLTENVNGLSPAGSEATTGQDVRTNPGVVMGTAQYMSPEQARGLPVDARTDVWSLGVLIYEMVAGRRPFDGPTQGDTIVAILEREPMPLAPDVPEGLGRIITKALAKEVEGRYQTVKHMAIDLRRLRRRLEVEAEIERSARLESGDDASAAVPKRLTTSRAAAAPTGPEAAAQTVSSAGYLFKVIRRHRRGVALAFSILTLAAAGVYLSYNSARKSETQSAPPPPRALTRLTLDPGLQGEPTWAPDRRFLAYSADRGGNFDIWVQPMSGGDPVQVTRSPAHDWQPDWSPDGTQLVFRSEREGGGLFITPAFGGRERRIAPFGYRPSWSPDGSRILFTSSALRNVVEKPKVYVTDLEGGGPREVATQALDGMSFESTSVIWHPDGRRISVWGRHRGDGPALWTLPIEGGPPTKSEVATDVRERIKAALTPLRFRWAHSGQALFIEGASRRVDNIWKVTVDPETLRWVGGPERLTTGPGADTDIALTSDGTSVAFTSRTERTRLWSLPFDARSGRLKGPGRAVTAEGPNVSMPDLSPDGRKIVFLKTAFVVNQGTSEELWEKTLDDDRETLLAADDFSRFAPHWSRDGSRLAYRRCGKDGCAIVVTVVGGAEQPLTSSRPHSKDFASDWSPDGEAVLAVVRPSMRQRSQIWLLPLAAAPRAEAQASVLATSPDHNLWQPSFSPDGRWLVFIAVKDAGASALYVAPSAGGEWTRITEENNWVDKPRWAPDGRTLYFVSNRDTGFLNVWGARFDPGEGRSVGEPFRVTSFQSPGRMIDPDLFGMEIDLAENRLVLPIMEVSGSIWVLDNVDR